MTTCIALAGVLCATGFALLILPQAAIAFSVPLVAGTCWGVFALGRNLPVLARAATLGLVLVWCTLALDLTRVRVVLGPPSSWRPQIALEAFRGSIVFLHSSEDVLAFIRETDGEKLLCVFNFAQEPVGWPLTGDVEILDAIPVGEAGSGVDNGALLLQPLGTFFARIS